MRLNAALQSGEGGRSFVADFNPMFGKSFEGQGIPTCRSHGETMRSPATHSATPPASGMVTMAA